MKQLTLIRGLPGSGKSTLAKLLLAGYAAQGIPSIHVEADMFFTDENGNYSFDKEYLHDAHKWCQESCDACLDAENIAVIVSNTFVELWTLVPYLKMAKRHGATVQILDCRARFGDVHNVPTETYRKMLEKWDDIPNLGFWGKAYNDFPLMKDEVK